MFFRAHGGKIMLFRQLFDADSSTYTYLLADEETRKAVLIDPVLEQVSRDVGLIEELGLELVYAADTHVHADHVTALSVIRDKLGCQTVLSEASGAVCADRLVKQGDRIEFGRHALEVRETPGHTNGCLTYVCHEAGKAFTGDALLIRGCGRTDFQQGDARTLYRSVHEQILSLPDATELYPGHDYKGRTVTTVAEEKRLNPRLGQGKSVEDFVRIMDELHLPHPRKMDVAVPANLECGVPRAATAPAATLDPAWAPTQPSPAGVPEVTPAWLAEHHRDVLVVDVREPEEFRGELGHVASAELVPLATLRTVAGRWHTGRPIVTVCRSGGRSGQAVLTLAELGFTKVASLRGGMREWNAQSLPVEFGTVASAAVNRQG
jgi:sulfur dioxygenase